jgi:hypothetical protein
MEAWIALSPLVVKTMGIVVVAAFSAIAAALRVKSKLIGQSDCLP